MEKKPHKPTPIPMPKPMPKPPMKPCHPVPPMLPHPCIPCDEKLIDQLYKHLKMCHRHEMEIIKMIKRYCMKNPRKHYDSPRDRWDSPCYFDSPYRPRNPHRPYESSSRHHPYESSSFRYQDRDIVTPIALRSTQQLNRWIEERIPTHKNSGDCLLPCPHFFIRRKRVYPLFLILSRMYRLANTVEIKIKKITSADESKKL